MAYLLLTDDKVFACRSFDGLAAKLLWAREQGYTEVKARFANGDVDRPFAAVRARQTGGSCDVAVALVVVDGQTEKRCVHCGETKPLERFPPDPARRDGRHSWCHDCHTGATRRWRQRNREAYNAKRRIDPYPPRTCATCGQEFTPIRRDQRYCRRCREHRYLTRVASGLPPDNLSLGKRT